MKKQTYTVWMLRDPAKADAFWTGHAFVKGRAAIKFRGLGKQFGSRSAALKAYDEYLMAVAMIEAKVIQRAARWDRYPATLDLVQVEVTKHNVSEEALPDWPQASVLAHYVLKKSPKQMQDAVRAALKRDDWESLNFLVVVAMSNQPETKATVMKALQTLNIQPAHVSFPHLILRTETELAGARLAIEKMTIYDFKTGKPLNES